MKTSSGITITIQKENFPLESENVDEKRLEETGQIYQSRFDIQNKGKYRLVIPAAIDKMMRYRDAHPEATIEETSKALGYTEEEMAAMIRNFSMI